MSTKLKNVDDIKEIMQMVNDEYLFDDNISSKDTLPSDIQQLIDNVSK